jgi:TrmH RNA methyltransferase
MSRRDERKVYGVHACRALHERRPEDILRVYLTEPLVPQFRLLLRQCAENRRPYKIVPSAELVSITESRHHEGICIVARPLEPRRLADLLRPPGPALALALVEVGNPHNVGAILRTAAHFGARGVLLGGERAALPPAAARTAQGGAEWVDLVAAPDLDAALAGARAAGFVVCATTSHGGRDLHAAPLPPRVLLLVGAEDQGLPPALLSAADLVVAVQGTGHVESLNVSAATAVLLAEHWRQHAGGRRQRHGRR